MERNPMLRKLLPAAVAARKVPILLNAMALRLILSPLHPSLLVRTLSVSRGSADTTNSRHFSRVSIDA